VIKENSQILFKFLKNNRWYLFFLIVICILQIFLAGKVDINDYPPDHDINAYRNLALSFPNFDFTVAKPFFHRLFVPWVVGLLFNNVDQGFFVVNFIFSILFTVLLYYFFITFGISNKISFFIVITFIFNRYFIPFLAFQPYRVLDLITVTILVSSIILLVKKKFTAVFLISIIGVLTKEIALLIIPVGFAYIYLTEQKQKNILILFSIYSIILVSIYMAVRLIIPAPQGITVITAFKENWNKIISIEAITKQLFIAFNPLFLIPVFQFRKYLNFNKRYPYLLVLLVFVLITSCFGGDKERLMISYAPIYYLFIASLFQEINKVKPIKNSYLLLVLAVTWISNLHHIWGLVRLPSREYSLIFALVGSILVLLIFTRIKLRIKEKMV
jgi:hypothetical protein